MYTYKSSFQQAMIVIGHVLCVRGVDFSSVSTIFRLDVGTCWDSVAFFFHLLFILILFIY